jgi:hypothetical protein
MQLTNLLTILTAVSAVVASPAAEGQGLEDVQESNLFKRSCYSGGKTWGDNRANAIDRAGRWCSGDGGSGSYRAGQTKYGCYNALYGDNKFEFWIQRTGTRTATLSSSQCNALMQEQIRNCERGGSGERNGWYFRYVLRLTLEQ